jgi:CrcB protein
MTLILLAVAGAAGTVTRYLVQGWVTELTGDRLPWGTFAVNISGSFAVGLIFALAVDRALLPAEVRAPLMIGFLGACTTFSTLMLETWRLTEEGAMLNAMLNVAGSSLAGIVAVVAGLAMGRVLA